MRPLVIPTLLLWFLVGGVSGAQESDTIVVDLDDSSVAPEDPTVNLFTSREIVNRGLPTATVRVRFKSGVDGFSPEDVRVTVDLPAFVESEDGASLVPVKGSDAELKGDFAIDFYNCLRNRSGASGKSATDRSLSRLSPESPLRVQLKGQSVCKAAILGPQRESAHILAGKGSVSFRATWTQGTKRAASFTIRLDEKPWALAWSGGFSLYGSKDERFRFETVEVETDDEEAVEEKRVIAEGDSTNSPPRISFFADFISLEFPWIAISGGLAVPLADDSSLEPSLGLSVPLRTLLGASDAYLSIGVAYAKVDRLASEFHVGQEVDDELSTDTLLDRTYQPRFFVALHYAFFGGKEKFEGVFSGTGGKESDE